MKKLLSLFFMVFASSAFAQVHIISPLPGGILQVHANVAEIRLFGTVSPPFQNFRYKIASQDSGYQTGLIQLLGTELDTLISVPNARINYTLYWFVDSSKVMDSGVVTGLTPGHIIGIAGQSNAQGYCWQMFAGPSGDIRMLRNDSTWERASEPTGNVAGGSWIVMANILDSVLGDSLPIGIVNTAIGGAGLTVDIGSGRWLRNPNNPEDSSVYGNALRRFREAGSEMECMTWIQGEADGSVGGIADPKIYQDSFANLAQELYRDLSDTFPVFHLQIGGDAGDGAWIGTYPQVRQAELNLPYSTMVGTALGLHLWDGRFHYNASSLWVVGRMFASAILKKLYGLNYPDYPPLLADSIAHYYSINDGSIVGHYCFALRWKRGAQASKLSSYDTTQYFAISKDGVWDDTSKVWFKIAGFDSSIVLVGLRNDSITLGHSWQIGYDAAAESERAPIATIDSASGDTIYGAGFWNLPVDSSSLFVTLPPRPLQAALRITPNPASRVITLDAPGFSGVAQVTLISEAGGIVWRKSLPAGHAEQITLDLAGEPSGYYLLQITNGTRMAEEKFVLER